MKFERGRKKNQLIWSFILKVIASQSLVNSVFKQNQKKRKTFQQKYAFAAERRTRGFAPPLKQREGAARVADSGSRGPTSQV